MSNPQRASSFNYQRRFKDVIWIQTRDTEDYSFNELQFIIDAERKRLGDGIFADGAVIAGLVPTVGAPSGGFTPVSFSDGLIWVRGRMEPVSGVTVQVPGTIGVSTQIFLEHLATQIDAAHDAELVDPNTLDPVDERLAVYCSLVTPTNLNPDALDEDFSQWVLDSDGVTPVLLNQSGLGMRPNNRVYGAWAMLVGAATDLAIGAPFWDGIGGLQFNHTNGVNDTIELTNVVLQPNTAYKCYIAVRTVYGQPDVTAPNGLFISIGRTSTSSPLVSNLSTTGGNNLLGDYTVQEISFTTDSSGAPMAIQLGIVSGAPTTQVMIGWVLITADPLGAADRTHHNYLAFVGTADGTIVPAVSPALTLPITARNVAFVPYEDIDGVVAPDTTPNVQDAIEELADRRAKLAGLDTQPFNVGPATIDTEAPQAVQIQDAVLTYAIDTGVANAYVGTYDPPITAYVDGMQLSFRALFANTGASTFDATGGSPGIVKPILHADGTVLEEGDINPGQVVIVTYQANMNGGSGAWQLLQPQEPAISSRAYQAQTADVLLSGTYQPVISVTSAPPSTGKNWLAFVRYVLFLDNLGSGNAHDEVVANVTDGTNVSIASSTRAEVKHDGVDASGFMPASYPAGTDVTFSVQAMQAAYAGAPQIFCRAANDIDSSLSGELDIRWVPAD
jgi:hypothetical protein